MSLKEALEAFLAHRMEVLERRSRHRLAKIRDRLEVVDGYLKAFLDIDRVIRIIRDHDQPKPVLIEAFELTDRQAEAILNLRLRQLRKLEEMELEAERGRRLEEGADLDALLADETLRRGRLAKEVGEMRARFGTEPRRTTIGEPPAPVDLDAEVPVERQPVTVVCSRQGWLRVLKGTVQDAGELKFKEGDGPRFLVPAQSTDKLLVFRDDGRAHVLPVEKLPGGRGLGEPINLFIDVDAQTRLCDVRVFDPAAKLVLATRAGRGFAVPAGHAAAQTRAGKQVVNLAGKDRLRAVAPLTGDSVAVLGTNRKLLIFPREELPEMTRGKGVILQRYRDGTLDDVMGLDVEAGLSWPSGSRRRFEKDLTPWRGVRATVGRNAPQGFPREGGFRDVRAGPLEEQGGG
jgi:topoisomerase-4 subunit A